jgi:hypothetical protein
MSAGVALVWQSAVLGIVPAGLNHFSQQVDETIKGPARKESRPTTPTRPITAEQGNSAEGRH